MRNRTECLNNWTEFLSALSALKKASARPEDLLFRGQANSAWSLTTTLERYHDQKLEISEYYQIIYYSLKPQVEAFTENKWEIPDLGQFFKRCTEYDGLSRELSFGRLPGSDYMAYLRHHGFPSPLLDWSRSPFVATYFAFQGPSSEARSIYVYSEMSDSGKSRSSGRPEIYRFGLYPRAHKRHFLQQSEYTICARFYPGLASSPGKWCFEAHDDVFHRGEPNQDVLVKFTLPASERVTILKELEAYNLNAFSLFGSEESLMETAAIREFDFSHRF